MWCIVLAVSAIMMTIEVLTTSAISVAVRRSAPGRTAAEAPSDQADAGAVEKLLLAAGVGAAHSGPLGPDTRQAYGYRAKPSVTAENNMNNVEPISIDK